MNPRKKRVLLVDDDAQVLESLQLALCERGYEVLLARDGAEGLMRAERDGPDLVVLDMMMPRRSGFLVLDRLRRRFPRSVPVILMTANDAPRHRDFAASQGADAFLQKPFEISEFLVVVETLLAG